MTRKHDNAAAMRARRAAKVAHGRCLDCPIPVFGTGRRCEECAARASKATARWKARNLERARRISREVNRRSYADPVRREARNQGNRDRRLARKLAGQCQRCILACVDGSNYCAAHDVVIRAGHRRTSEKRFYFERELAAIVRESVAAEDMAS